MTAMHSTPLSPVETDSAQQLLRDVFGYGQFRPGQRDIIDAVVAGRDALVVMPTGAGKSICYQLPALLRDGVAIVVSPLVALMKDQVDQLAACGVAAAALHSGLSREEQLAILQGLWRGDIKLLFAAPERLLLPSFRERLQQLPLALFAIDEAHCICQWGYDFRPEYAGLGELKRLRPEVPVIALTATADGAARQEIEQALALHQPLRHLGSFNRPNLRYHIVEKFEPIKQLERLLQGRDGHSGIIYCGSRARTEQLAERLNRRGIRCGAYHAGLAMEERSRVQEAFRRDELTVVVATVAFGMGINKPNVRFVLHYDLPRSIEAYYQETGRAGRDGLPAETWMFYDPADKNRLLSYIDSSSTPQWQQLERHRIEAMGALCEAQTCRRVVLLSYFGETSGPCGNCDICLDPPVQFDATIAAQQVLSCIYRMGQRHGLTTVVEVLRGSEAPRLKELGFDRLSTHGIGRDKPSWYWVSIIRQLIHRGLVEQRLADNALLRLTEAARPVLRGDEPLLLATPRPPLTGDKRERAKAEVALPDRGLFQQLRSLRRELAERDEVPPYVVFNDATLQEMARLKPQSADELRQISGVGTVKLGRYGADFLQLLRSAGRE